MPFLFALLAASVVQGNNNVTLSLTLLALVLEGVGVAFFWRRLPESALKTFASVWFTLGLWAFMVGCLANALLEHFVPGLPSAYFASLLGHGFGISSGVLFAVLWAFGHQGMQQLNSLLMILAATGMAITIALTNNDYLVETSGGPAMHSAHGAEVSHDSHKSANVVRADADDDTSHSGHDKPHAKSHAKNASKGHGDEAEAEHELAAHDEDAPVHWTYDGDTGADSWGALKEEWATCAVGAEQSPVDIPRTAKETKGNIILAYQSGRGKVLDNGHTIQFNVAKGSKAVINGRSFDLKQFHFHAPSEHEINGTSYPMEVHFVHADRTGKLAVIGAFIEKGAPHRELGKVLKAMPLETGKEDETLQAVALGEILPKNRTVYQYPGSLTTPPCTEGVLWSVMKTPITMSAQQIALFRDRYDRSNRPVQPMNDRSFGKMPNQKLSH
jgi:carbonic anhydrase